MLVLSRKLLQTIKIGDDITITIKRVGKTVSLGIEAPTTIRILRGELDAIDTTTDENRAA